MRPSQKWLLAGAAVFFVGVVFWAGDLSAAGDVLMYASMAPLTAALWLQRKERRAIAKP